MQSKRLKQGTPSSNATTLNGPGLTTWPLQINHNYIIHINNDTTNGHLIWQCQEDLDTGRPAWKPYMDNKE